jgi:TPR repeat protein
LHEFAIEQVLVDAQYKKAELNRIGAGVEQSNLNAAKWYELSAKDVNHQHSFVWAEYIPKDTYFIKMTIWRIGGFL